MLIEIHMLKNYPSTNLNRDDMGAPKSCVFGGVQRARISSQCLKRSWRVSPLFQKEMEGHLGMRTRKMPQLVASRLREMGVAEELLLIVEKKLTGFANKGGKENDLGITNQIVIYSQEDIQAIADVVKAEIDAGKTAKQLEKLKATEIEKMVKNAQTRPVSLDIALFGRMVTSPAFADVEASMQVAHAFSTNRVVMETDFFTAMDDMINGQEDLGSGMMGDVDYNSSCYYIYASLDTDKLRENLQHTDDAEKLIHEAVPALLRAMAYSNPSGKQNTFAGNVLPSAVLVECKDYPIPVSYANAFVEPVKATADKDLVLNSIDALKKHMQLTVKDFPALATAKRIWFSAGGKAPFSEGSAVVNAENYDELIKKVDTAMDE